MGSGCRKEGSEAERNRTLSSINSRRRNDDPTTRSAEKSRPDSFIGNLTYSPLVASPLGASQDGCTSMAAAATATTTMPPSPRLSSCDERTNGRALLPQVSVQVGEGGGWEVATPTPAFLIDQQPLFNSCTSRASSVALSSLTNDARLFELMSCDDGSVGGGDLKETAHRPARAVALVIPCGSLCDDDLSRHVTVNSSHPYDESPVQGFGGVLYDDYDRTRHCVMRCGDESLSCSDAGGAPQQQHATCDAYLEPVHLRATHSIGVDEVSSTSPRREFSL